MKIKNYTALWFSECYHFELCGFQTSYETLYMLHYIFRP